MKRISLLFLSALIVTACASQMRYSAEEIKDLSPSVQAKIKKGEISVGMSKTEVRYSWGGPSDTIILQPAESGAERVEWIYEKAPFSKSKLIFTGDKLTEIISSEPWYREII